MALTLALPAAVVGLAFVLRGAPARPLACLAAAAAGAAALGGFATHVTCMQFDPTHLILGHALVPAIGALLLALPVWALCRRAARDHG
jgi:hypothetical protein